MPDHLLALSFLQPWLWAILERHKGFELDGAFYAIENRTWRPPRRVLGQRIALHASAGWDADGEEFVDTALILAGARAESPPAAHCVRGALVGTARVVGALRREWADGEPNVVGEFSSAQQQHVILSPWAFGPWCWVLADVRKIREPAPCKGALGFWKVPADVAALVREGESA